MSGRYPQQIKDKTMDAIKNHGYTVREASEEYWVNMKTINYWFRKEAEETGVQWWVNMRDYQRLKKSNEDLLLIIWELTAELNKTKKKR